MILFDLKSTSPGSQALGSAKLGSPKLRLEVAFHRGLSLIRKNRVKGDKVIFGLSAFKISAKNHKEKREVRPPASESFNFYARVPSTAKMGDGFSFKKDAYLALILMSSARAFRLAWRNRPC
jgi:hypothetical protein